MVNFRSGADPGDEAVGLTKNGEMDTVYPSSDYDRETKDACIPLQFELASAPLRNFGRLVALRRIHHKARVSCR